MLPDHLVNHRRFPTRRLRSYCSKTPLARTRRTISSPTLVWLEHLIGDVHQPLHATSRFTRNHPHGDAGGNFLLFCAKPCRDELHAYWDGLLGDKPTIAEITHTARSLLAAGKPAGADDADPTSWIHDSFQLATTAVYTAPISDDNDPSVPISDRPGTPGSSQSACSRACAGNARRVPAGGTIERKPEVSGAPVPQVFRLYDRLFRLPVLRCKANLFCSAEPRGLCGDPRIFADWTKCRRSSATPAAALS